MEKYNSTLQAAISSLMGLIIINGVMLGALFAQVPPNPPGKFGPYIGATLSLAVLSLSLSFWRNRIGYLSSIIVGLMCLLSLGPQKFFLEQTAVSLAPVIILGSILSVVLIISSFMTWREKD
ncbi:MAG: hypothetical protein JRD68_16285 [Deltaproteobacteria bacterium]|nr:hypothetical protein [Deltaproteobacteria bacterium]